MEVLISIKEVKIEDGDAESKPEIEKKPEKKAVSKQSKRAPPNTTGIYTVFVGGFEGKDGRRWLYTGQYKLIEVDDLTWQEWLLQDNKVSQHA